MKTVHRLGLPRVLASLAVKRHAEERGPLIALGMCTGGLRGLRGVPKS